ncbi:hypothetical protein [Ornithinibacillus halotolerans]|uniref:Uncharacterized protein n=1 Tax=Ornithinibacillus halotolerans TaxID=1274357 RepID=A0A916W1U0_9BACI|nr:hypothetical protein [Ornithinibacillus halotolerans]GGA60698.1 hypothetical protein GCM10008025_00920 [Ornithinibacillus halotolerans]
MIEPEPTPIQSTNSQPIQHEGDRVHVESTESQPQLTQSYQQVSTNNPTKQGTTLQEYKTSFTQLIKNPTNAFTLGEKDFSGGLISIGLYIVTFGIAFYLIAKSFLEMIVDTALSAFTGSPGMSEFMEILAYAIIYPEQFANLFSNEDLLYGFLDGGTLDVKVEFFDTFLRGAFISIIFLAVGLGSMIVMSKIAKSTLDFKTLITRFSGLVVPFVLLNGLALIISLLGSSSFALILLMMSLFFITVIIPVILTFVNTENITVQRVYISLASGVVAIVISYFIVNNYLDNYLKAFEEIMNML